LTPSPQILIIGLALVAEPAALWAVRQRLKTVEREDGAPTLAVVRAAAAVDLVGAAAILGAALLVHLPLVGVLHLWRHDPASALFVGALAGFLLHFAGGGSPLAVASLTRVRGLRAGDHSSPADLPTVVLFVLAEVAAVLVWFGAGLGTLQRLLPRLVALALVAIGFGLRRAATGQDQVLLGAIDGFLLGLLAYLSGSLIAVLVAHLEVDLLAYVRATDELEEADPLAEFQSPAQTS
jgi:hypothetical protein